ncbi:MAG: hypothetical protein V3U22_02805, partial [Vicinamibacteria bacterium]
YICESRPPSGQFPVPRNLRPAAPAEPQPAVMATEPPSLTPPQNVRYDRTIISTRIPIPDEEP